MLSDREKVNMLIHVCEQAHKTIIELAYLAAELSENDIEKTANEPFNETGYAFLTNRRIEEVLTQLKN